MTAESIDTGVSFGFVSVIRSEEHGLFGGYLVLNEQGRPLEFHCTAPVQANRAQEILYGATLEPFLYGEQIGQTLISAARRSPRLVCTDMLPVLAMQPLTSIPVLWVADRMPIKTVSASDPVDLSQLVDESQASLLSALSEVYPFAFADHLLLLSRSMRDSQDDVCEQLTSLLQWIELREPFTRIQAAIEEAHRNARGEPRYRQAG